MTFESVHTLSRREFVRTASTAAAATLAASSGLFASAGQAKRRYAIVGTGDRGSGMWGADVAQRYADLARVRRPVRHQPEAGRAGREA